MIPNHVLKVHKKFTKIRHWFRFESLNMHWFNNFAIATLQRGFWDCGVLINCTKDFPTVKTNNSRQKDKPKKIIKDSKEHI